MIIREYEVVDKVKQEITKRAKEFFDALERDNPGRLISVKERTKIIGFLILKGNLSLYNMGIKKLPAEIGTLVNLNSLNL